MVDSNNKSLITDTLPKATIAKVSAISSVWLIPLVALLIGAWMMVNSWRQQGPVINIAFSTAQGITVNQSLLKLRDIPVGKVIAMRLNNQLNGVILTVRLNKNTQSLLTTDSQFWVVKPRIGIGSISGLSTLLSGAYIELSPGRSSEYSDSFLGLDNPPLTPAGTPGLHITLDSNSDQAFDIGDPILYHGSKVGRIEYKHFNIDDRKMYYNAFIDAPYDQLITSNTRFWEIKGIDVDLSADGLKVTTGTLETFLDGGVAFDVPNYLSKGEQITERAFFSIYPNKEKVNERLYRVAKHYILLFKQTVRGLKPGSAVEFNGIKVGKVVRTDINYPEIKNFMSKNTLMPVMINIAPGRLGLADNEAGLVKLQRRMVTWVAQGLHGTLAVNNLLTGSKYINLTYIDQSSNQLLSFGDVQLIPTADGELAQLLTRIKHIVETVEKLPINKTITDADTSLNAMKAAMVQFNSASTEATKLLQQANVAGLINQADHSLRHIEKLADSYTNGSATNQQLNAVLQSLNKTMHLLNPLLIQLQLKPNSLVFPSHPAPELQPKGQP